MPLRFSTPSLYIPWRPPYAVAVQYARFLPKADGRQGAIFLPFSFPGGILPDRIAIFIDGAYLGKVIREEFRSSRIDYQKLSAAMAGESRLLRTYYYDCPVYQSNPPTATERERYANQRRFFNALELTPRYKVRLGRLIYHGLDPAGRPVFDQKQVDVLLSVDLVQLAARGIIQEAVLVAGDNDFIPAVQAAQADGVVIRLFHGATANSDLIQEVDERVQLTQTFIDSLQRQS